MKQPKKNNNDTNNMFEASVSGRVQGFDDVIGLDEVFLYLGSCDELTGTESHVAEEESL